MGNRISYLCLTICLSCMLVVCVLVGMKLNQYAACKNDYQKLQGQYEKKREEIESASIEDGIQGLEEFFMQKNPDYIAWIRIPGTSINYPVLQGQDNDYYLTHSFEMNETIAGSIFADCSMPAFSDTNNLANTILYGHNMKDGSMFGTLKKYRDKSYFAANHTIEITIGNDTEYYKIYAVAEKEEQEGYQCRFAATKDKEDYIEACVYASMHDSGMDIPGTDDKLLTLSTCSTDGKRLVISAYADRKTIVEKTGEAEG